MSFLSITIDPARLKAIEEELSQFPAEANKAISDALNATAREGRKLIVQSYFKGTTLQQKAVLSRVSGIKNRATPYKLDVRLAIKGKPIAATQFQFSYNKASKAGVQIQFVRGRAVSLPNAFVGTGPRGKPHILQRGGPMQKVGMAHYKPNYGKIRQKVVTQSGRNLIQITEMAPEILAAPLEKMGEILSRKTADGIDKVLNRKLSVPRNG